MSVNWLLIILVLILAYTVSCGYKKGMVKELASMITLIVVCLVLALVAGAVRSYLDGNFVGMIASVVLGALLGLANYVIGFALFPAKLIAKLPLIRFVDKLLGVAFGVLEVILLLWMVYSLVMMFHFGEVGEFILSYTRNSNILIWIYERNYLAYVIERLLEVLPVF